MRDGGQKGTQFLFRILHDLSRYFWVILREFTGASWIFLYFLSDPLANFQQASLSFGTETSPGISTAAREA